MFSNAALVDGPKVGVGIPVRNGGELLIGALETIVNQTYRNLEIIISDNDSDDDTESICTRYAALDNRIKYYRQTENIGSDNFRFVLEQSTAEYFMWAAHDDRRSLDYVEKLLGALMSDEKASLAFGDVSVFHDFDSWREIPPMSYSFATRDRNFWRGLVQRSYIPSGYLHIYGLVRRSCLDGYFWPEIEIAGDRPFLLYLWCRGNFIRAEGAHFYCYKPTVKKTRQLRAESASEYGLRPFPYIRLSWVCARAAHIAEGRAGRRRSLYLIFLLLMTLEARKKLRVSISRLSRRLHSAS